MPIKGIWGSLFYPTKSEGAIMRIIIANLMGRIARLERQAKYVEFDGRLISKDDLIRLSSDEMSRLMGWVGRDNKSDLYEYFDLLEKSDELSQRFYSGTEPVHLPWEKDLELLIKSQGGVIRKILSGRKDMWYVNMMGDESFNVKGSIEEIRGVKSFVTLGNRIIRVYMEKLGLMEGVDYILESVMTDQYGEYDLNQFLGGTHRFFLTASGAIILDYDEGLI